MKKVLLNSPSDGNEFLNNTGIKNTYLDYAGNEAGKHVVGSGRHIATKKNATSHASVQGFEQNTFSSAYSGVNIAGMSYIAGLNYLGQVHNDFQETILQSVLDNQILVQNNSTFVQNMKQMTMSYFSNKGFVIPAGAYFAGVGNHVESMIESTQITPGDYSPEGYQIMTSLLAIMHGTNIASDPDWMKTLLGLQAQAAQLSTEDEVYRVGLPVTIAIYSYAYWGANANRWGLTFRYSNPVNPLVDPVVAMRIGYGQLGFADVTGGIQGAFDGVVLGPGGAAAGAILGASSASLMNLFGQIITSKIGWW